MSPDFKTELENYLIFCENRLNYLNRIDIDSLDNLSSKRLWERSIKICKEQLRLLAEGCSEIDTAKLSYFISKKY